MTDQLKPCPFCGAGITQFDETKHWLGTRYQVIGVTVQHWCDKSTGFTNFLQIKRKTKEEAIEAWNTRAEPAPSSGLKPSPELVAQWSNAELSQWVAPTLYEHIATKAAEWGAQQRGVVVPDLNTLEIVEPPEVKGRFASEMFWRGVNAMKAAIAAAKEKPCGCNTDWSDQNRPLITVCAKHMGAKGKGE